MLDHSFEMKAFWGARVESPSDLAKTFLDTLKAIVPLNACLGSWNWTDVPEYWETEGQRGTYPFEDISPDLEAAIVRNMGTEDDGMPDPFDGYLMIVETNPAHPESNAVLSVNASHGAGGGSPATAFVNHASFTLGLRPDPSLVSYDLLRSIFLVLNETWQATWGWASPGDLPIKGDGRPVHLAWMSYVSPHFAPMMTPPPSAVVERRPNGGLFLAATRDVFETANPAHLAVAREIEAALQPLNRIPNPNDAPYR